MGGAYWPIRSADPYGDARQGKPYLASYVFLRYIPQLTFRQYSDISSLLLLTSKRTPLRAISVRIRYLGNRRTRPHNRARSSHQESRDNHDPIGCTQHEHHQRAL